MQKLRKTSIFVPIRSAFIASAIINGFDIYANFYAVSENGSDLLLWISGLAGFLLPLTLLLIFISLIGLIFSFSRRICFIVLLCGVLYFSVGVLCFNIGNKVRMNGFKKLAIRSKPLIEAINNYERKHNRPPENLYELIPEFIVNIPKTGMAAYPEYKYKVVPDTSLVYEGNPWVIVVSTPDAGINFDQFMYFPKQNYPKFGYGGLLERVEDWAYVHE